MADGGSLGKLPQLYCVWKLVKIHREPLESSESVPESCGPLNVSCRGEKKKKKKKKN